MMGMAIGCGLVNCGCFFSTFIDVVDLNICNLMAGGVLHIMRLKKESVTPNIAGTTDLRICEMAVNVRKNPP